MKNALGENIRDRLRDFGDNSFEHFRALDELNKLKEYARIGMALEFIRVDMDESGFTYDSINEIMGGYKKRLGNCYNSYTMNQMIDSCEESLKILYPYWYTSKSELEKAKAKREKV